ncbi:hypothetical protein QBC45DRAFT_470155 [Copromyces sp. CBS 386.78]|nr:hypothetical protein QBC45DRAFT_470155 [Copromyces sp. CBS 386.78]
MGNSASPEINHNHDGCVDPRLLLLDSGFQRTETVAGNNSTSTEPADDANPPDASSLANREGQATSSSTSAPTLESPGRLDWINHGSQPISTTLQGFTCAVCGTVRSQNTSKKDFKRHEETRGHLEKIGKTEAESGAKRFHCSVPTCKYTEEKSFTRKDNLKRHLKDVHKIVQE